MGLKLRLWAEGQVVVVLASFLTLPLLFAQEEHIFIYRPAMADRVTAVVGGGYFPVVCRLRDGSLAAVVRGGGAHLDLAGRLDLIVSRDGGKSWSGPSVIVDSTDDDRNPAFGQLNDGTLILAYIKFHGYEGRTVPLSRRLLPAEKIRCEGIYVIRSQDLGKTWDKPTKIDLSPARGFSPYGKILQLTDGTALMSLYADVDFLDRKDTSGTTDYCYLVASKDGGKTWGTPTLVAPHFNETALAELPDGRLVAALRSEKSGAYVAISSSRDEGRTWSEPRRVTENSEHPADLLVLADGRLLLTYGERNRPYGARALVSRDGGATWEREKGFILAWDAKNGDCGYPSSVQLEDGRILTVYYQVDDLEKAPQTAKACAVIWRTED